MMITYRNRIALDFSMGEKTSFEVMRERLVGVGGYVYKTSVFLGFVCYGLVS